MLIRMNLSAEQGAGRCSGAIGRDLQQSLRYTKVTLRRAVEQIGVLLMEDPSIAGIVPRGTISSASKA
jgi:hypothetical protein